jgi:hypothetical protein
MSRAFSPYILQSIILACSVAQQLFISYYLLQEPEFSAESEEELEQPAQERLAVDVAVDAASVAAMCPEGKLC